MICILSMSLGENIYAWLFTTMCVLSGMQKLQTAQEQDEACRRETDIERQLHKMGQGRMGWNTHHVHVFSIPIHPRVREDDALEAGNPQGDGGPEAFLTRMLTGRRRKKTPGKKPCCCCCDDCQHSQPAHPQPVYARWDNGKMCFVPCYREGSYVFANPPFYYRYMGLNDLETSYAWIPIIFVLVIFIVLISTDGYNRHWHYDAGPFDSNSPALAAWILLIACGGLLVISLVAWWIYVLCTTNSSSEET